MIWHRLPLAGLLATACLPALASVSYAQTARSTASSSSTVSQGPGLQASGPDTPPAAVSDRPGPTTTIATGVNRPSPVITSAATPTLNDALAEVYLTNPALLSERAHLRSTDEQVPSALSGWRPQISVTVSPGFGYGSIKNLESNNFGQLETVKTRNDRFEHSETAQLSQPLYRGGRTTSAVAQAENAVRAERARLLAQEEQSFSDTVSAFVTVIEDEQLYELQVSNVQVLTKQLEATNARFSVGEITRTDVAQAQAALAGAIAQRETALGTLQTARATYRATVGEMPDKLIEPQPLSLPIKSVEEAETLASVNNASVVAAEFDDSQAKDAVNVAFAALMPEIDAQASVSNQYFTSNNTVRSNGGVLGGTITVPIYQGGAEYAAIRQAKQNEQASRKTLDNSRRTAVQQANQFWEQLVAARATVTSTRAQIRADEIALDGVEREALAGTQTTQDVLYAEQQLLSARVTLVQNLASVVNSSYSLAGSIGRLTARDLGLKVPLYDETAYYHAVRDLPFSTNDAATHQPGR